jgi:hypothetical protein
MEYSIMEYQRGQILLVVVLVMVTALTIGLSVAARSITNIHSTQEAATSEQAFSAAEAGIEKSLTSNSAVTGSFSNNATYKTTIITVGGTEFSLNNGSPVLKDEPADLWLSTYPSYNNQRSGNVTIYWGKPSDVCSASEASNTMAALEIIVFSGNGANMQTTHYAVDPCGSRRLVNDFKNTGPGDTVAGDAYKFSTSFVVNNGLFIRIIPIYAPTIIAARGCDTTNANCSPLPTQGTLIQAVGTVDNTQRKIQTYRYYPQLPAEILQYSFFIPK